MRFEHDCEKCHPLGEHQNADLYYCDHDCEKCHPLGEHQNADLYYCDQDGSPTVIARYSDDGADYVSGSCFATRHPDLAEAKKRDIKAGHLPGYGNGNALCFANRHPDFDKAKKRPGRLAE